MEACHLEYLVDTFPEQTFINQAWSDTRLETRNSSGGVLVLGLNPSVAWGKSENIVPPFVPSIEDKRFCLRDVERISLLRTLKMKSTLKVLLNNIIA